MDCLQEFELQPRATFIKLLRITNYPSLAVLRAISTPQREAVVHKLTEKKQPLSFLLNIEHSLPLARLLNFIYHLYLPSPLTLFNLIKVKSAAMRPVSGSIFEIETRT